MRILVAEDNILNQELIQLMLETLGHSCDVAGNGLEALQALEESEYDVILMDLQMPKMGGVEAARQIHQKRGTSRPRIIALTATASKDPALDEWMDDFLTKPVSREALQAVLNGLSVTHRKPAMGPLATLDLTLFVNCAGDDPDVQQEFATVFQAELSQGIKKLKRAVDAGKAVEAGAIAHGLKGASVVIGALKLGQMLGAMEDACRAASVGNLLGPISEEAERVQRALADVFPP